MSNAFEQWLKRPIYAPKLPWKKGEVDAFRLASATVNDFTTPIFVIPPAGAFDHDAQRILSPADHIRLFGPRLQQARSNRPVFIDAVYLDDARHRGAFNVHPLTALLERARLGQAQAWPVTSHGRSDEYQLAVAKAHVTHGCPVAIQISLSDLSAASLRGRLSDLRTQLACPSSETVLIIDCGPIFLADSTKEEEFSERLINAINHLPNLHDWAQIILTATSLGDISKIKPHEQRLIRRSEWQVYKMLVERRGDLLRLPIFSDYGVDYREDLKPIKARPSAKLNYTTNDNYFFVKGENVKTGGYEAIFSVAERIVGSQHFFGSDFSSGDARIWLLSQRRGRTGNAPTWRWVCADHHLAVISKELFKMLGIADKEFEVAPQGQEDLFSTIPAK